MIFHDNTFGLQLPACRDDLSSDESLPDLITSDSSSSDCEGDDWDFESHSIDIWHLTETWRREMGI